MDTYKKSWPKDLKNKLKEFEKLYVKHQKGTYSEMAIIHSTAMKPLMDLVIANLNLHNLENMIKKKKDVPEFRLQALEEEF